MMHTPSANVALGGQHPDSIPGWPWSVPEERAGADAGHWLASQVAVERLAVAHCSTVSQQSAFPGHRLPALPEHVGVAETATSQAPPRAALQAEPAGQHPLIQKFGAAGSGQACWKSIVAHKPFPAHVPDGQQ
jgi:hypothetical protein